jgi:hypothetical protein
MNTKIAEEIKEWVTCTLRSEFKKVYNKELHYPVGALLNLLTTIDGLTLDEKSFDTNGCAWDWWVNFTYKHKPYMISGSGWDGGLTIYELENDT